MQVIVTFSKMASSFSERSARMESSTEASGDNLEITIKNCNISSSNLENRSSSYSTKPSALRFLEEGNCSINNGDYETAIEHYKRCLEAADENSMKMMAYFCLGNAYTLDDKQKEGRKFFNDCLSLSSEVESKYFQHKFYLPLGRVNSISLEGTIKKDEMVCLCHIALGGINKLFENYEKSLSHYKEGFQLIECQQTQQPQKVVRKSGINVSKDFIQQYMKNLSIITSDGIVNGVLAIYWELAELFHKLEQWGDATYIYEIYLNIVENDEDMEKQKNALECLIQIYEMEGRTLSKDFFEKKLHELDKKIKDEGKECTDRCVLEKVVPLFFLVFAWSVPKC